MLKRGGLLVCVLLAGLGTAVALAGSGSLDPTFGTGGTTVLDRTTSTFPTPAAVLPGGKLVVVSSANNQIVVSRLLANGAPDPSFDGDGQAVLTGAVAINANAVAVQPDGKIVVVGQTRGTPGNATVWRLNADGGPGIPNGALDPTFDTDGVAQLNSSLEDAAYAVAIQPDGKLVVAGRTFTSAGGGKLAVWRLKAGGGTGALNGALDPAFNAGTVANISLVATASDESAAAVALAPDGKILVAGATGVAATGRDAAVWRLKANGGAGTALNTALDPTFDTDGQANLERGGEERANAMVLAPDGKIVVAGQTDQAAHGSAAMVWRLLPNGGPGPANGALDPTFDTDGAAVIDQGAFASASAVALAADGKILVAGTTFATGGQFAATIWRLAPNGGAGATDGALDPTFGTGGATASNAGAGAGAEALVLGPGRKIVAAGATNGESLFLMRVLGDPFALTVAKAGTGAGTVSSAPAGIDCGATCAGQFDEGTAVTLTATAAAGSKFVGWSGAGCSGTAACTVAIGGADQAVTATFDTLPTTTTKHFVLKSSALSMKAFSHFARSASATVAHLPLGTKVSASLIVGRKTVLARSKAVTAGKTGRAFPKFTFSRTARKKLASARLTSVTLSVSATPKGDRVSKATKRIKLKRLARHHAKKKKH